MPAKIESLLEMLDENVVVDRAVCLTQFWVLLFQPSDGVYGVYPLSVFWKKIVFLQEGGDLTSFSEILDTNVKFEIGL